MRGHHDQVNLVDTRGLDDGGRCRPIPDGSFNVLQPLRSEAIGHLSQVLLGLPDDFDLGVNRIDPWKGVSFGSPKKEEPRPRTLGEFYGSRKGRLSQW
jgi:hypothetical protein